MVFILAGCATERPDLSKAIPPTFSEVTVHDPSVMKAGDTFYIVGSHLQTAKSKDLLTWEQMSSSLTLASHVMPNAPIQLQEALQWAKSDTLWAGDWIYLEGTGKYHMYYCSCEGTSPRSAMGMAVSDNPDGPYTNVQVFLKSGMWDEKAPDGRIYDPNIHPNAIDPHVFYDADGQLWMIYGSYSGGIYILKMDDTTGLPEPDQGYGKHLLGGRHGKVEAPYVLYNPETKYYYLFLSYGGLDSKGGYQIRVSRSKQADGPYEDISGQNMSSVSGDINVFKKYGQKLFGNYSWTESADPLTSGYVSPGHNSAYYDKSSGKSFLIFHSRFPGQGELHHVRVHELLFTEDGWPVAAPYRYAGTTVDSLTAITEQDAVGAYQFINHGKEVGSAITQSSEILLNKDGSIAGSVEGSWKISEDNKAEISIGTTTWKGYFVWQWQENVGRYDICFTAVAQDGTAVWGAKQTA